MPQARLGVLGHLFNPKPLISGFYLNVDGSQLIGLSPIRKSFSHSPVFQKASLDADTKHADPRINAAPHANCKPIIKA
jgi:hypothetical protein